MCWNFGFETVSSLCRAHPREREGILERESDNLTKIIYFVFQMRFLLTTTYTVDYGVNDV